MKRTGATIVAAAKTTWAEAPIVGNAITPTNHITANVTDKAPNAAVFIFIPAYHSSPDSARPHGHWLGIVHREPDRLPPGMPVLIALGMPFTAVLPIVVVPLLIVPFFVSLIVSLSPFRMTVMVGADMLPTISAASGQRHQDGRHKPRRQDCLYSKIAH